MFIRVFHPALRRHRGALAKTKTKRSKLLGKLPADLGAFWETPQVTCLQEIWKNLVWYGCASRAPNGPYTPGCSHQWSDYTVQLLGCSPIHSWWCLWLDYDPLPYSVSLTPPGGSPSAVVAPWSVAASRATVYLFGTLFHSTNWVHSFSTRVHC